MNRFEYQIRHCMDAVEELLTKTENPLHRAILNNYRRHVHLEASGQFEKIVADDMMADHPVYRVTWGDNPVVIEEKEGVIDFYNSVKEAVLWNSDDRIAVADWGIADELTFHQITKGKDLANMGFQVDDLEAYYHLSSRQVFLWPYDEQGRLKGEHLYEDKTSVQIEKVDPEELITPQQVKEIHLEILDQLEKEKGENYWVYHEGTVVK
ncbi:hypothetical protein P9314_02590 [Paenibacillus validus]|uniref:hypothetical protein n=1 Tax=Paenibacillus TaxID=44249 RepID=UPI000FD7B23D|nr:MULTISPECIES: hypothetical protein [Paenibacillus]MED4599592.1 hypothetical protein [Paenibacillus validus]MED4605907.1 hypothetical protein [Paenibacillus validus]